MECPHVIALVPKKSASAVKEIKQPYQLKVDWKSLKKT